jgi:hypothetical protein
MEFALLREVNSDDGRNVNDWGRIEDEVRGDVVRGVLFVLVAELSPSPKPKPNQEVNTPVSTMFREAIMVNINQS